MNIQNTSIDNCRNIDIYKYFACVYLTVDHIFSPKMQCPWWDLIPGPLAL